jgi:histidinol-phosphatase (PHP family)
LQPEDLAKTFDAYVQEATRLKVLYADQIELLIGLETEYITPDTLDKLDLLLEQYSDSVSYIVGSLHHVNGTPIDFDRATFDKAVSNFPAQKDGLTQLEHLFSAYFDAQYELLRRLHPEVVGHIDLCRLYLPDANFGNPDVWKKIERNVGYAVDYGALFEVNAAAFRKGWKAAYPGADVLKVSTHRSNALEYQLIL